MGDQTTTRTHVRRAQCSFGGEIAGERDRTALISQSPSCATFPQSGTNHMPPKRAVNPDNRRRPATHASSKMSSMNLSENLDREIQLTIGVAVAERAPVKVRAPSIWRSPIPCHARRNQVGSTRVFSRTSRRHFGPFVASSRKLSLTLGSEPVT